MKLYESIPYAREILRPINSPFKFDKAVFLRVRNDSAGEISYTFGSAKITLQPGQEDSYPSYVGHMTGQITFFFPPTSSPFKIKFYKIELIENE